MAKKPRHPAESRSFVAFYSEAIVRLLASDAHVPIPILLLDFLARHKSGATIYIDQLLCDQFNTYLEKHACQQSGGSVKTASYAHFRRSCYQLRDAGILLRQRGHAYTINPRCAWRGSMKFLHSQLDTLNRQGLLPESPSAEALSSDVGDQDAPESPE